MWFLLTGQVWPTTESEAGSSQSYITPNKNGLFSRTSGDQGTRETPTRRSTSGLMRRDVSLRYNGFRTDYRFVAAWFVFVKNDHVSYCSDVDADVVALFDEDVPYFESPPLHTVHMSTSSTQHTPRRYHVPLRRVAADLVQLKYDALPFEISPVYISFTLLALINIMAVCEFLKLADSFPEVITHSDVTARLGWLTARLRHLADQKWL